MPAWVAKCRGAGAVADRGNKVPFIAAVQTTKAGSPLLVCLSTLGFTKEAITQRAKKSRCVPRPMWYLTGSGVSSRLRAVDHTHERTVTGGGAASVKLERFRALDICLGYLKTLSLASTRISGFRFRQVCPSLPRRDPISVQLLLQSVRHS